MNIEKINRILSYVLVALIAIMLTVSVMMWVFVRQQQATPKLPALEQLILNRFIGDVDQTAIEDAAARAMIAALGDRWSYYISADQYADFMEQANNAYIGVGLTIMAEESGGIRVVDVTKGGPAEEAGILADDVIIKVDGQSILDFTIEETKKLVLGDENTIVQLTLLRGEQELTLDVTRRTIRIPVAKSQMLENNIGYVAIYNFNSNSAAETIAAIEKMIAQGAKKLVLDVRNNPGGNAKELVKILDYLLPEGKLFTTVDYAGKTHTDWSDEKCLDIPMAVLVNGNSYSAAEFFAAALSEYDAAIVVGEKTCGKGYFQHTYQLSDGSLIGLSVGKYYTPNGKNLQDTGIIPDVIVSLEDKQDGIDPMPDAQIAAAVKALEP